MVSCPPPRARGPWQRVRPEAEEREERSWTRSAGASRSLGTAHPPTPPTFWNIPQDLQKCGRVSISAEGKAFFLNSTQMRVASA